MNLPDLPVRLSRDKLIQLLLAVLVLGVVIALLATPKPWNFSLPEGGKLRLRDFVGLYSWWAALINLAPLLLLTATTPWWMRSLQGHSFLPPSRPNLNFRLIVGVAMLACAALNAPRLGHSLWDDEEYSVRRYILGSYQQQEGHQPKLKEVRWSETLWSYAKPNNHFLNSILSRLSNSTWRLLARPQGLQFSETAVRFPAYLAGVLSVGVWALLLARIGFPTAGMILAWLIVLHPWYMRFIPQTRGYALVFLFLPLACWLGLTAVQDGRWRYWIASGAAQFALFYSWPGSAFTLVILNLSLLGFLLIQGHSTSLFLGRWLVSSLVAGMVVLQLTLPCMAQLHFHLHQWDADALGGPWLMNIGTLLLTGLPWHAATTAFPRLDNVHPLAAGIFLAVAICGVFLGILKLARARIPGVFLLPVFLLPGPAAYFFALWKNTHLFEWYMVFMVPGLLALLALGICSALTPLASRHRMVAVAGVGAFLLFFACVTQPARAAYIGRPVQWLRESVLMTRPGLNPFDPRNEAILTITTLASPEVYDPNVQMVRSGPELKKLLRAADAVGQSVYVNQGYSDLLADKSPDVAALIFDPTIFEKIATLPGFESFLDRDLYRYRPGSLPPES